MSNLNYTLSPIYGNCQVLSPDNILMFRCDQKRANWYLKKIDNITGEPIGELISNDPYIIRLRFKPKGLGNHNKKFGLVEMSNKCVNCGSLDKLNRHHVVPYCYRKFLPIKIKSHNFHDVLPLCINCHERYERLADIFKTQLSVEYNAPINGEIIKDKSILKYSKIANTLLYSKDIIPKEKIKKLKKVLKDNFKIKRLTNKNIRNISEKKSIIMSKTHGNIVISKVEDIQNFIERWRMHFINNNDCKFLPKKWSIKTKIDE